MAAAAQSPIAAQAQAAVQALQLAVPYNGPPGTFEHRLQVLEYLVTLDNAALPIATRMAYVRDYFSRIEEILEGLIRQVQGVFNFQNFGPQGGGMHAYHANLAQWFVGPNAPAVLAVQLGTPAAQGFLTFARNTRIQILAGNGAGVPAFHAGIGAFLASLRQACTNAGYLAAMV